MGASRNIKIALIDAGMQQKELAEKLNITSATISKMLKNDNINYNRAEEIAEILGYEIIWKKKEPKEQEIQNINNNGIMGIGIQNNNK